MKVAAIQLNAEFADVPANLRQAEQMISEAARQGAEVVVLPEFFTSAIGFAPKMLTVVAQNAQVKQWLMAMAARHQCMVGGSYLVFDGVQAYNLFTLALPNGQLFEHKKDLPTQFENCYYTKGDEVNILPTPMGPVGVALCWEMIRYDTVKRLKGKVHFVLAGSCWWDLPINAPAEQLPLRQYNQSLALNTPVTFAKLLGVPVIHASHCGMVTALRFPAGDAQQTRQLVGGGTDCLRRRHCTCKKRVCRGGRGCNGRDFTCCGAVKPPLRAITKPLLDTRFATVLSARMANLKRTGAGLL